jgi:hypothetical protein
VLFIPGCDVTGKVSEIRHGKAISEKQAEAFPFSNGVNIQIMRTFTKLREMIASHKDLTKKLKELEKKYDGQFQIVFEAIRQLIEVEEKPKRKIGFLAKEQQAVYRTSRKR